jgi:hypothetical protein
MIAKPGHTEASECCGSALPPLACSPLQTTNLCTFVDENSEGTLSEHVDATWLRAQALFGRPGRGSEWTFAGRGHCQAVSTPCALDGAVRARQAGDGSVLAQEDERSPRAQKGTGTRRKRRSLLARRATGTEHSGPVTAPIHAPGALTTRPATPCQLSISTRSSFRGPKACSPRHFT